MHYASRGQNPSWAFKNKNNVGVALRHEGRYYWSIRCDMINWFGYIVDTVLAYVGKQRMHDEEDYWRLYVIRSILNSAVSFHFVPQMEKNAWWRRLLTTRSAVPFYIYLSRVWMYIYASFCRRSMLIYICMDHMQMYITSTTSCWKR